MLLSSALLSVLLATVHASSYPIVDTGQTQCYDATTAIPAPEPGQPFHGQDAQVAGHSPSFQVSVDGLTVLDATTGLTWMRQADTDRDGILETADKRTWTQAVAVPASLNAVAYGGFTDWRLPDIKTLYSLIDFRGVDPSGWQGGTDGLIPFIDTTVFGFLYGATSQGERIIDAQYWSATPYVSTTMNGDPTAFGVNFADGRIKGYPISSPNSTMRSFVLCVRGAASYGQSELVDNGDGTVSDLATGLMWQCQDNGAALSWQSALSYAEGLDLAGHDDWRLPDAKELQSIVDYTRSPATHGVAAIAPPFQCTGILNEGGAADFPCYWSSTTHANWTAAPGNAGAYVAFGRGLGWIQSPFPPFSWSLLDVHGAGCQRSDPKTGNAADYPHGRGPQGDVIRILNFVRCVRSIPVELPRVEDLRIDWQDGRPCLSWSAPEGPWTWKVYSSDRAWAAFPGDWTVRATGLTESSWCGEAGVPWENYRVTVNSDD